MQDSKEYYQIVRVADFTVVPGARYRSDGDSSAEEFFEDHLKSVLKNSLKKEQPILLDFDNTWGYASSFISELARRIAITFDKEAIRKYLELKSDDEPSLIERFWKEFAIDYEANS